MNLLKNLLLVLFDLYKIGIGVAGIIPAFYISNILNRKKQNHLTFQYIRDIETEEYILYNYISFDDSCIYALYNYIL